MSKSNQDIWDELARLRGWYELLIQPPSMDYYAEAIREDQREVCATEYYRHVYNTSKSSIGQIILNAGKEPKLKPGMLVGYKRDATYPWRWTASETPSKDVRPLTKAEIQAYMDKAPDDIQGV